MKRWPIIFACLFISLCTVAKGRETPVASVEGARHSYKPGDKIEQRFTLYYNLSDIEIDPEFLNNSWQMDTISRYLAKSPEIDSITVYAYSSPEGPLKNNETLTEKRAQAAKKFILDHANQHIEITVVPVAENWAGLIEEIENNYKRSDKQKILRILKDTTINDEVREVRLKSYRASYNHILKHHMPQLRKATWTCVWVVPEPSEKEERLSIAVPPYVRPVTDTLDIPFLGGIKYPPIEQKDTVETADTAKPWLFALKTNLLYDAVTALNAEAEFPIGKNFSIMAEDVFPWWNWGPNGNKYCFQIWEMGIEPRWWFKKGDDLLLGHFAGIYGMSSKYDFQNNFDLCYQGECWSTGLTYGYTHKLGKHLRMEYSISVGYLRSHYRHYQPDPDYEDLYIDKYKTGTFSYFGLTKLKISLVLPIKFNYNKD